MAVLASLRCKRTYRLEPASMEVEQSASLMQLPSFTELSSAVQRGEATTRGSFKPHTDTAWCLMALKGKGASCSSLHTEHLPKFTLFLSVM